VKASSLRVASRVANTLRAGAAVTGYENLAHCPNLVISAGTRLPRVIAELSAAKLKWKGRTVLVCGNVSGSSDLPALAAKGASIGSLDVAGVFDPPRFVVEGDAEAVKLARVLMPDRGRLFEIAKDTKTLYSSGVTIAASLLAPTAAAGVQCLRRAGMPLRDAVLIVEKTIAGSLRAYVKAGLKGWTGPLASGNTDAIERQLEELRHIDPLLERYFRQNALLALEMFARNSDSKMESMTRMLERRESAHFAQGD
jgi:predicted short-subunit dehydrogenase-like oxidoreductase (DUF2520 family)